MAKDDILTTWNLETGGAVKSVDELHKAIKKEQKEERQLSVIRKRLDEVTGKAQREAKLYAISQRKAAEADRIAKEQSAKLEEQRKRLEMTSRALAHVAGSVMFAAMSKLRDLTGELIKDSSAYAQAQRQFTGDLEMAKQASLGLATELDLMQAKNQLYTLGVKMTSEEYASLVGNLTRVSTAMGTDLKMALESATTAMARQSAMRADNVGVVMKAEEAYDKFAESIGKTRSQLTDLEKRTAFQKEFLEQLGKAAEGAADRVMTLGDAFTVTSNKIWDAVTAGAAWVNTMGGQSMLTAQRTHAFIIEQTRRQKEGLPEQTVGDMFSGEDAKIRKTNDELADTVGLLSDLGQQIDTMAKGGRGGATREFGLMSMPLGKSIGERALGGITLDGRGGGRGGGSKGDGGLAALRADAQAEWDRKMQAAQAASGTDVTEDWSTKAADQWTSYENSVIAAADAIVLLREVMKSLGIEEKKNVSMSTRYTDERAKSYQNMANMGKTAFLDLAGGIWAAADAAVAGQQSFGAAMAAMLKATLQSIAREATIQSMVHVAKALSLWWTGGVGTSAELGAAAAWAGVAAAAGGAALGMTAGGVGRNAPEASSSSARDNTSRPSFGERKQKEQQTLVVNLYLDPNDPSSQLIAGRKITSMTQQALGM